MVYLLTCIHVIAIYVNQFSHLFLKHSSCVLNKVSVISFVLFHVCLMVPTCPVSVWGRDLVLFCDYAEIGTVEIIVHYHSWPTLVLKKDLKGLHYSCTQHFLLFILVCCPAPFGCNRSPLLSFAVWRKEKYILIYRMWCNWWICAWSVWMWCDITAPYGSI